MFNFFGNIVSKLNAKSNIKNEANYQNTKICYNTLETNK